MKKLKKKSAARAVKKVEKRVASVVAPKTVKATRPAVKHAGLGRGLGALIGGEGERKAVLTKKPPMPIPATANIPRKDEKASPSVLTVPVTEIQRSPWQPRQVFDEGALQELADSIRANGIIQPLICRKLKTGRFELIGGERRLRAGIVAGLTHVPIILVEAEDRKAAELAIVENIQRADLNAIEEAEGYRTLSERFGLTQSEVAERVGKARPSVANALRLLELPDETKTMVADGRLSPGHAKVLLGLPKVEDRIRLGRRAVAENLTVRSLERAVAQLVAPPAKVRTAKDDLPAGYLRDLTDRLHAFFGTAVRVAPGRTLPNGRHAKGTIEIDFYGNADLDRLLTVFGVKMD